MKVMLFTILSAIMANAQTFDREGAKVIFKQVNDWRYSIHKDRFDYFTPKQRLADSLVTKIAKRVEQQATMSTFEFDLNNGLNRPDIDTLLWSMGYGANMSVAIAYDIDDAIQKLKMLFEDGDKTGDNISMYYERNLTDGVVSVYTGDKFIVVLVMVY